ncbi:DNA-protecting protein DprA [Actinoplanes sp. NEAU-A11]|uniref:DNA-protecting protein DprA n=1 Tax=Actinoplanes aureus TaxID=2792083 RepID=A0A931G3G3_9ACTN|nr:DNA-protecting protein DprA [Actinoplanes aureus]
MNPLSSTPESAQPPDETDRLARIALTWLVEPGNRTVWSMVERADAPAALERLLAGDIADAPLRAQVIARAATGDARRIAEIALRRAQRIEARLVVPSDGEWPASVNTLAALELDGPGAINRDIRPPLCFWVRGSWPLAEAVDRSAAIVGARAATSYGTQVSSDLAYGLADRGWTVVAGGGFGIEAAAHRGALAAGGRTVAFLSCGVDRPYPAGNSALFDQIADRGLLISEWPIGAEPLRHRFLVRNRIIAAATRGTVIIEAAKRSGAAQTIGRALVLNRPAMVVPGPVTSVMSAGCHEILRSEPAARLVTSVDDVLSEMAGAAHTTSND